MRHKTNKAPLWGALSKCSRLSTSLKLNRERTSLRSRVENKERIQEHPLVLPHVSHFRHVPFRTIVKFWHSEQATPT